MVAREIFLKFALVFILSFIYGLNRQKSHKPVGFGTFILVATGACALSLIALETGAETSIGLLAAIVTGIGFLGAGALIRNSDKIFGFTTASSIWVFAIFGMTIGLGKYTEGIVVYSLIWVVILFDGYLEKHSLGSYRREIQITCSESAKKEAITEILSEHCTSFHLVKISIDKKEKNSLVTYLIEGPKKEIENLLRAFHKKEWCYAVRIE